jgi:serine/threonine-protein kinase
MSRILCHDVDPPSRYLKDLPANIDEIVLRGLATNPADRYATASEMADALADATPLAPARDVARFLAEALPDELASRAALAARAGEGIAPPIESDGVIETSDMITRRRSSDASSSQPVQITKPPAQTGSSFVSAAVLVVCAVAIVIVGLGMMRFVGRSAAVEPTVAAAPIASPTPSFVAVAPPPTVIESSVTPAVDAGRPSAPRRVGVPQPTKDCRVPYVIDADGTTRYKRECLR